MKKAMLLFPLGLLFLLTVVKGQVWCTSCNSDYRISKEYKLISESFFTDVGITTYLSCDSADNQERFVLLTPDASLYQRFVPNRAFAVPSGGPWATPVQTKGPIAYFYDLGENAFCQFKDTRGHVEWRVLRGRNIYLPPELEQLGLIFVGQQLTKVHGEPCESAHRVLEFVVNRIEQSRLLQAARDMAAALPIPRNLTIHFTDDLDHAVKASDLSFPSLQLLDEFRKKPTPADLLSKPPPKPDGGLSDANSLTFFRLETGNIRIVVYDGTTKKSHSEDFAWAAGSPCK